MIEITQMALSYYLNKQQKDYLLRHHEQNGPESPARARSAICRSVKSFQMIQTRVESQRWNMLLNPVTFYEFLVGENLI